MAAHGKFTVSDEGVLAPGILWGRDRFLPWDHVVYMRQDRGLVRIFFREPHSQKIRVISRRRVEGMKSDASVWRTHLLERFRAEGNISGSTVAWPHNAPGSRMALLVVMTAVAAFQMPVWGYILVPDRLFELKITAMTMLLFSFLVLLFCLIGLSRSIRNPWAAWKITKQGLFRKTGNSGWSSAQFLPGDYITPCSARISGKPAPIDRFHYPVIVPHLLAVLAEKNGVPVLPYPCGFLWPALRMFFFWPLLIAGALYLSARIWPLPSDFPLLADKILPVAGAAFFFSGLFLFGIHGYLGRYYGKEFRIFLEELEEVRSAWP